MGMKEKNKEQGNRVEGEVIYCRCTASLLSHGGVRNGSITSSSSSDHLSKCQHRQAGNDSVEHRRSKSIRYRDSPHASEAPVGHIPSSAYSCKPRLIPNVYRSDKFRNGDNGNPKLIHDHGGLKPGIHELHAMVVVEVKAHALMHRSWPSWWLSLRPYLDCFSDHQLQALPSPDLTTT
ncbi:hypothetical protein BJV74DRAFT_466460 [Russula compacta]|nr:hypothetical protein BJV74DRAFT_466460 [Russula compacta]